MSDKYEVTCLSPVHIGTGHSFTRFDSVYNAKTRHWMPVDLDKVKVDPNALAKEMENRDFAWCFWLKGQNIDTDTVALYQVSCAQDPENTEVRETIKTPYFQPYIPGSTLKGALRTAVLWDILNNTNGCRDLVKSCVFGHPRKDIRYLSKDIEKKILGSDPNHDILRTVQVSDTTPATLDRLRVYLTWTYTIHNKKLVEKREENSEFKMFAECFTRKSAMNCKIKIDEFLLKQRNASALRFNDLQTQSIKSLSEVCNRFSFGLINSEREFYKQYGVEQLENFYNYLEAEIESLPKGGFLLNIGWGGGWEPKTIGVYEFLDDQDFYELRKTFRLGRLNSSEFPKTRRVVYVKGEPEFPLGWVSMKPIS